MTYVRSATTDNSSSASADLGVLLLGEVFDRVADALLVLDPKDQVIAANRAAEELFGVRSGALLGMALSRLSPVGAPLLALLLAPDRNGPLELEMNLQRPVSGNLTGGLAANVNPNVTANVSAFRLDDGRTVLLCRVASGDALSGAAATREERRAAAVLESSRDVFVVIDEHGHLSYASPSASSWGLDRHDVTEGDLWRAMHPRDRDAAMAALGPLRGAGNRPAAQSRSVTIICRFRYLGTWRWFELVATDMSDDSEVKGLVVQAREVNERVQNTQELRVNEAYFRTLFERSQEGVVLVGRNRRLIRMGGAAARLLGLRPGERADTEGLAQLHPNDRDALEEALDLIEARAGATEHVRFRHQRPDGNYVMGYVIDNKTYKDPYGQNRVDVGSRVLGDDGSLYLMTDKGGVKVSDGSAQTYSAAQASGAITRPYIDPAGNYAMGYVIDNKTFKDPYGQNRVGVGSLVETEAARRRLLQGEAAQRLEQVVGQPGRPLLDGAERVEDPQVVERGIELDALQRPGEGPDDLGLPLTGAGRDAAQVGERAPGLQGPGPAGEAVLDQLRQRVESAVGPQPGEQAARAACPVPHELHPDVDPVQVEHRQEAPEPVARHALDLGVE